MPTTSITTTSSIMVKPDRRQCRSSAGLVIARLS
jgi:hypothetical protein